MIYELRRYRYIEVKFLDVKKFHQEGNQLKDLVLEILGEDEGLIQITNLPGKPSVQFF